MDTREYLDLYIQDCRQRGLSPATMQTYESRLRHFADENPELPTGVHKINDFLKVRGETPKKRGKVFDAIQGFYTYLERAGHIKESPVPPKGKMGRPTKFAGMSKLHQGGGSLSNSSSTSISTTAAVSAFMASRQGLVTEKTYQNYSYIFNRFAQHCPELPFSPEPIEEFLASLKVGQATKFAFWKMIGLLYRFLDDRRRLFSDDKPNPFKLVIKRKLPRQARPTLELDQWQRILALDLTLQERAIFCLLGDCGPRSGEIITLVRERVHPGFITVIGKTGQFDIPISKETYELLIQLADTGLIFTTPAGKPMPRMHLYRLIRRRLEEIGYTGPKKGAHLLRHTYGRHYMAEGGDLSSLKEIFGHEKIETTQHYAELAFTDVKRRHREVGLLAKLRNGGTNDA